MNELFLFTGRWVQDSSCLEDHFAQSGQVCAEIGVDEGNGVL